MPYKNSSKCRRRKMCKKDNELKEYINENKRKNVHIVTTRFTNETWNENMEYLRIHKEKLNLESDQKYMKKNDCLCFLEITILINNLLK